jgi:DNA (cytosine-5)-methyltransferase 1
MRILGVYAGIGSPMVKALRAGHQIIGNIEPRSFAHVYDDDGRNTFLENFPGSWLVHKIDEVPKSELQDIDIICGHPKCGRYSQLINKSGQERKEYAAKQSDEFLEFIRITNILKPKFTFFDNLPKSLEANPPSLYRDLLPDYNIQVEYISNYYYGNCQKNRNRLFIIASLKELEYTFVPGEMFNRSTLRNVIHDLENNYGFNDEGVLFNHNMHSLSAKSNSGRRVFQDGAMTWEQVRNVFRDKKDNKALHYINKDGEMKYHFGFRMADYDRGAPTLIGTHPVVNPVTYLPLSVRERARVQGFPDDFYFYGTNFEDDGTWVHNRNSTMIKQTGRCIPVEFPGFLIKQFEAFVTGDPNYMCSCRRIAKPNHFIETALSEG